VAGGQDQGAGGARILFVGNVDRPATAAEPAAGNADLVGVSGLDGRAPAG
jgi:hypothetical protein